MKNIDTGVIKELIYGIVVAAVCFGAPTFMKYMFPNPTVIHDVVDSMPLLGSMIIGVTIIRLLQRKKSRKNHT
ncbi:hypothetical protein [Desulfopila aestuarii]|uniref:Uncharacterized protein n=1 Tax=Desulfopila aestuarii DSM 18488 TaxID=1121416 RepID=A0A1M7XYZ6_9BACT|nr:hypothetical protein [Desulfopila aestuarii]SHO44364.1 hypothetical protein SAMN02745220_00714 [Desulfopila aestuarii DSM 18488]